MKLIGVIVKVEHRKTLVEHRTSQGHSQGHSQDYKIPCKISINLTLPHSDMYMTESKQATNQLMSTDKKMEGKLSLISYGEEITEIKTYKPFYIKKRKFSKDIIVTFVIPKRLSDVTGLSKLDTENMYGVTVKIKSSPIIYNFTDKNDIKKKIKGWKLKMKSIEVI